MEYLTQNVVVPYLRDRFQLTGTIKARVLHIAGVGESTVDDWIGDLMMNPNPTVGLLAHPGQVDIRITAKADTMTEADGLIANMEAQVRQRVQEGLYGVDFETLEETILQSLRDHNLTAAMVECGLNGALRSKMERVRFPEENVLIMQDPLMEDELRQQVENYRSQRRTEVALGISLLPTTEKHILYIYVVTPTSAELHTRSFGGERALSSPWSVNTGLEMLRRKVLENNQG
jgi:nicotinamide-nucleotide amidase